MLKLFEPYFKPPARKLIAQAGGRDVGHLALGDRHPHDLPAQYVDRNSLVLDDAIAQAHTELQAAQRQTAGAVQRSTVSGGGIGSAGRFRDRRFKRRIRDLKLLSESAIPSRAISLWRNGVAKLEYNIRPKEGKENLENPDQFKEAEQQILAVLENPNHVDDDFFTFIGQIVEDLAVFDAGVWEYVDLPEIVPAESNPWLAMHAVAGYTIQQSAMWDGRPEDIRWAQVVDNRQIQELRDDQLEYLMARKRSHSPHGLAPLEVCVEIMEAWLGVSAWQRETASNSFPRFLVWLGEDVAPETMELMRTFWEMEMRGRGTPGFWANTGKPELVELKPEDDTGLFLKYQEMLVRVLAFCFNLKPQDFGIERDVNRAQGEISQTASVEEAIKPIAELISTKINCKVLPRLARLTGNPLIRDMEFFWLNLDQRDAKAEAEIRKNDADADIIKLDDGRAERGLDPLPNGVGQLTQSAYRALVKFNPELALPDDVRAELFPDLTDVDRALLERLREEAAQSEEASLLRDQLQQETE